MRYFILPYFCDLYNSLLLFTLVNNHLKQPLFQGLNCNKQKEPVYENPDYKINISCYPVVE